MLPKPHAKPEDDYRFTEDFRNLNEATETENFPISNIKQIFRRIGQHKSKYFAVMDLPSGYHQTPMHIGSVIFTAFICSLGIFEWPAPRRYCSCPCRY